MTKKQNALSQKEKRPSLSKPLIWMGAILFLIPNIIFIYQGFSARYWADDYCFSGFIEQFGFFRGLSAFYSTTSNRFSAFIFTALSELFGNKAIRFLPGFVILSTGVLLYLLIKKLMQLNQITEDSKNAFFFSQVILFFILYLSPNIDQSVYWRSGLTHYFLPIPVLLLLLLLTNFSTDTWKGSKLRALFIFIIAILNAGLSESYAALQFGLFSLILVWSCAFLRKRMRKWDIINNGLVLFGTICAMTIMILSPGNSLRLNALQQAPNLFSIITISSSSAFNFIKYSLRGLWLPFGILFVISLVAANISSLPEQLEIKGSSFLQIFLLISLSTFGLILCVCAPTAYGMMAYPEQRVLMLAHGLLVLGIFSFGIVIGIFLQKYKLNSRIPTTIKLFVAIFLCLYPITNIKIQMEQISVYISRAKVWDERDTEIRFQMGQGNSVLKVRALDSFSEIAELSVDDQFWVNQCAANYYDVDSISAVEIK